MRLHPCWPRQGPRKIAPRVAPRVASQVPAPPLTVYLAVAAVGLPSDAAGARLLELAAFCSSNGAARAWATLVHPGASALLHPTLLDAIVPPVALLSAAVPGAALALEQLEEFVKSCAAQHPGANGGVQLCCHNALLWVAPLLRDEYARLQPPRAMPPEWCFNDTLLLARRLPLQLPNLGLSELAKHLGCKPDLQALLPATPQNSKLDTPSDVYSDACLARRDGGALWDAAAVAAVHEALLQKAPESGGEELELTFKLPVPGAKARTSATEASQTGPAAAPKAQWQQRGFEAMSTAMDAAPERDNSDSDDDEGDAATEAVLAVARQKAAAEREFVTRRLAADPLTLTAALLTYSSGARMAKSGGEQPQSKWQVKPLPYWLEAERSELGLQGAEERALQQHFRTLEALLQSWSDRNQEGGQCGLSEERWCHVVTVRLCCPSAAHAPPQSKSIAAAEACTLSPRRGRCAMRRSGRQSAATGCGSCCSPAKAMRPLRRSGRTCS